MNIRFFFVIFFCLTINFDLAYARVTPSSGILSQNHSKQPKPVSPQDKQIEEFLQKKKRGEILKQLEKYNETYARRFETLLLISYPFTTILTFISVQAYGLLNAGESGFQMNRTHSATVVIGSAFLSLAVAFKGYSDFRKRKEKLKKSLLSGKLSYFHREMVSQRYITGENFYGLPEAKGALSKNSFYLSLNLGRYYF